MAVVLRALALLSVCGASLSLFVQELIGSWLTAFVTSNTLTLSSRQRLITWMVIGGAFGVVGGLVAWWTGGARRIHRLAHLLAPGIALGLLPPLWTTEAWPQPLNACLAIAVFLLLTERLLRMSYGAAAEGGDPAAAGGYRKPWASRLPDRVRRWLPLALVVAGALAYGIYFSVFTLRMHGRFQTYNYDLGQYDNIFWSTLHGYPMRDSPLGLNQNWHELRNHASLSVFFFLPFYAIKPGGPILLVMQSFVIGLGAIPLYRFAARRLPRSYAVVIAFAYLLFPPTHGMQFYDFHFQPIAATLVLCVIDFVDDRRYWLCGLAFIVAVGCREDISVGLAFLGAFLALSGHRIKPGIVIAISGAVYFVIIRFIVMPSFGGWGFQDLYKDLMPSGARNFGGIIATMVSNPLFTMGTVVTAEKLRYMLQVLLPLALLPVRRSYLVVSVVPGSIFTIVTTQYGPTIDIGFQYSAHFIPYIFTAAAICLRTYGMTGAGLVRRRAALTTLVLGTILCGVFWGAVPPRDRVHGGFSVMSMLPPTASDIQKDRDLRTLHAMIPPDASVAIGEAEMTHVSRLNMKGLRDTWEADYILYATSSGYGGASNAERALASGDFERIAERPGLALLKRRSKTAPGSKPAVPVLTAPPPRPVPAAPAPPPSGSALPPRNLLPGSAPPLSPGSLAPTYPPRERTQPAGSP